MAPIRSWASERLSDDVRGSLDRLARSEDVRRIAVMPDVHLAEGVCVGVAFATHERLYPGALGGDIGCGMAAVALEAERADVDAARAAAVRQVLAAAVPVRRQRERAARRLAARVPPTRELTRPSLRGLAEQQGPHFMGTLGTGNHFLELQHDVDSQQLWLMVHSGSRGMGPAIRDVHEREAREAGRGALGAQAAGAKDDVRRGPVSGLASLKADTERGRACMSNFGWADRFAAANRRAMLEAAGTALANAFGWSPCPESRFDCEHNGVRREMHEGHSVLVHRKGAMAVSPVAFGIVPGSMASPTFHVSGRVVPEALASSAHGAGRAMSRSEARRRIDVGRLRRELRDVSIDPRALAGLREEAPSAYKDVHAVMKAQRRLVRVRRTLSPIVTFKGVGS
ncbi:MAG: RtcB family protein [Phycisphaerales bacterium]